ncbi:unnamed protein product [Agarophyton chilense]
MTHQSGLLLLRAQDASVAIAFASRFALVCIANFAVGFGAGYLYAQYQNLCVSEEKDSHAASEDDKASVTQQAPQSEQFSTVASDSAVEEQHDSLEKASRKLMDSSLSDAEPKSPPATPLRTDDEALLTGRVLINPNAESSAFETASQEVHGDLDKLNTASGIEEEQVASVAETAGPESTGGEEQKNTSIVGLQIQPIHGCLPQSVTSLKLSQHGVENHLLYAVSEFTGRYISNEKVPLLSDVSPTILENGHLSLSAPGQSTILHEPKLWGQMKKITIYGVQYEAVDQGDNVSKFFANYLEIPGVRLLLVRPPPLSDGGHRLFKTWPTADRPLLITSEESLTPSKENGELLVGTNLIISSSEPELSKAKIIKIDEYLFEIVNIPREGLDGGIPTQHLLGGGNTLVPVNLGGNECSVQSGQRITIVEFRAD